MKVVLFSKLLERADELFANYGGDKRSYVKNGIIPAAEEMGITISIEQNKEEASEPEEIPSVQQEPGTSPEHPTNPPPPEGEEEVKPDVLETEGPKASF